MIYTLKYILEKNVKQMDIYFKDLEVEREVGGGIGMGNTCKSMADSFQCMTKPTTIKKNHLWTFPLFEELLGYFQTLRDCSIADSLMEWIWKTTVKKKKSLVSVPLLTFFWAFCQPFNFPFINCYPRHPKGFEVITYCFYFLC